METCDQLEFDVVEVADTMGWQLPLVKRGLRQLQWSTGEGMSPNNWAEQHSLLLKILLKSCSHSHFSRKLTIQAI